MYYFSDKKQLNAFLTSFRKLIISDSPHSTPKIQKLKELFAKSFGYKSYTALISSLDYPLYIEHPDESELTEKGLDSNERNYLSHEIAPHLIFARKLKNEPFGMQIKYSKICIHFKSALNDHAMWDQKTSDEITLNSILDVADGLI